MAPPVGALLNYEALAIFGPIFLKIHGLRKVKRVLDRILAPGHIEGREEKAPACNVHRLIG